MAPTNAQMQAKAEAAEQFAQVQAVIRDDVVNGETAGALSGMGMGVSKTQATNGANTLVTLFHAYDGRAVSMPSYGVENRLRLRFPDESSIPVEYRGKQVWLIEKPSSHDAPRPFLCRLNVAQTDEIKADMMTAGFVANCIEAGGHPTQFEADEHFRKRHPRRWQAYERYLTGARQTAATDAAGGSNDRLAAILEQLIADRGK